MSASLLGAVFYLAIPKAEKLLLLAMADHANDDGSGVYPGNARLARKSSSKVRNVSEVLASLEGEGLIMRVAYPRGGRGHAVEWAIDADRVYTEARENGWTQQTRHASAMFTDLKVAPTRLKVAPTRRKGGTPVLPNHHEPSETRARSDVSDEEVEAIALERAAANGARSPKAYAAKLIAEERADLESEARRRRTGADAAAATATCLSCDADGWIEEPDPDGVFRRSRCRHQPEVTT